MSLVNKLLPLLLFPALASSPASAQCQPQIFGASQQAAGDSLGSTIALHGNRAAVTAIGNDVQAPEAGAVLVFENSGAGWVETATLFPEPGIELARFGSALALDDERIVVGASGGFGATGQVYVFRKEGNSWILEQSILDPTATGSGFGRSVALDDEWLLIGHFEANETGTVYFYRRSGTTWVLEQSVVGSEAESGHWFGWRVGLSEGRALVTAPQVGAPSSQRGVVYAFEQVQGLWIEQQVIEPTAVPQNTFVGLELVVDRNLALVGSFTTSPFQTAPVYALGHDGNAWSQTQRINAPESEERSFGETLALDGERALISSPNREDGCPVPGVVYTLHRAQGDWTIDSALRNETCAPGTFGYAGIALSPGFALVGNTNATLEFFASGAVHAFEVPTVGIAVGMCDSGAPCGNGASLSGCVNSTGRGATLSACGSASVQADDLALRAWEVPAQQFGLLFFGTELVDLPFGDGIRRVGAGAGSLNRLPVRSTGPAGEWVEGPGIVSLAQQTLGVPGQINPGDTWYFQAWYRDPAGPCSSGFNLSNAFRVEFTP